MGNIHEQVKEFHFASGHPVEPEPVIPTAKDRMFRCRFIVEEALEFIKASGCKLVVLSYLPDCSLVNWTVRESEKDEVDIVEVADAIGDLNYVVEGAALTWGIPSGRVGDEVHRSNMTKAYPDGRFHSNEHGKVIKPATFTPPDIETVLFGSRVQ